MNLLIIQIKKHEFVFERIIFPTKSFAIAENPDSIIYIIQSKIGNLKSRKDTTFANM